MSKHLLITVHGTNDLPTDQIAYSKLMLGVEAPLNDFVDALKALGVSAHATTTAKAKKARKASLTAAAE